MPPERNALIEESLYLDMKDMADELGDLLDAESEEMSDHLISAVGRAIELIDEVVIIYEGSLEQEKNFTDNEDI